MASKPDKVKAPKANYEADMAKYIGALQKSLPGVLGLEQQYRPEFSNLNLSDINAFLGGSDGLPGILALSNLTRKTARAGITRQPSNMGALASASGQLRSGLQGLDPQGAGMVNQATAAANQAYASAGGLTPQEERSAQQFARESYASRGRLNDNASIAGELLNRDSMLAQKRQEAMVSGQNAYGMSQGFYGQPGLNLFNQTLDRDQTYGLMRDQLAMNQSNQLLGYGLAAIGMNTPQMVDVGMGFNLGAAQRQNQIAAQSANAQAQASYAAGIFGALGNIAGAAGSAAIMRSDIRLKQNIEADGTTHSGYPVYTFEYKAQPGVRYRGVMAQDVIKTNPSAVVETEDGYLAVDYSKL